MAMFAYGAGAVGQEAANMFELNGRVMDMEKAAEDAIDVPQNRVAFRGRHILNEDVTAQGVRFRSQAPDVQIVDVDDAGDLANGARDIGELQAFGQALEEDVDGIPEDVPGRPNNRGADQKRQDGVDREPAGEIDHNGAGDNADAACRVAQHVDPGGSQIQIGAVAIQAPGDGQIQNQADGGHPNHDAFRNRLGMD